MTNVYITRAEDSVPANDLIVGKWYKCVEAPKVGYVGKIGIAFNFDHYRGIALTTGEIVINIMYKFEELSEIHITY